MSVLICRLKTSVHVDLTLFENNVGVSLLSKEWFSAGAPHIVVDDANSYHVVLYNKHCGILDEGTSKSLGALAKLSSVITEAFVGLNERENGHCQVFVNVKASKDFAKTVITTIFSSFDDEKFECMKHLSFSKQFIDLQNLILSAEPKVSKRKSSSSLPNVDNTNDGSEKRVKLTVDSNHTSSPSNSPSAKVPSNEVVENSSASKINAKLQTLDSTISITNNELANQVTGTMSVKPKCNIGQDPSVFFKGVAHVYEESSIIVKTNELTATSNVSLNVMNDANSSTILSDTNIRESSDINKTNDSNTSSSPIVTNNSSTNILSDTINKETNEATDTAISSIVTRYLNSKILFDTNNEANSVINKTNDSTTSTISSIVTNPLNSILSIANNKESSITSETSESASSTISSIVTHDFTTNILSDTSNKESSIFNKTNELCNSNTNIVSGTKNWPAEMMDKSINGLNKVTIMNIKVENNGFRYKELPCSNQLRAGFGLAGSPCFQNGGSSMSDLPEHIKQRVLVIEAEQNSSRSTTGSIDKDGLPSLNDERGAGNICNFLLSKDSGRKSTRRNPKEVDLLDSPAVVLAESQQASSSKGSNVNIIDFEDELLLPNNNDLDAPEEVVVNRPVVFKDAVDELFDGLSEHPKDVEIEPCPMVECKLLTHQKVALNWMIARENTTELSPFWECITADKDYFNLVTRERIYEKPKTANGGILADDMGLGKTLTTISLILTNHINGNTLAQQKKILPSDPSEICDLPSIMKKKRKSKVKSSEKNEVSKPGFMFRQMYLDSITKKKKKKEKKEKKKDPDQILFSDNEDDSVGVKTKKIINNLSADLDSSDAINKMSTDDKENRKTTLIVCPMSVLSNWTEQIEQHVNPSAKLQVYSYYGPERIRELYYLKRFDIILTTYGTLTCDYRIENKNGKIAPLHQMKWLRIVLDEGHIIRNPRSQQHLAALALNSARRWILSGTTIQNRMTDLWSMLKFLCLEPFSERSWWNVNVIKSLERRRRDGKMSFSRIQKLVRHIAIRRLKSDKVNGQPLVNLPKREVILKYITLSEEEQTVYDQMQNDGKFAVERYLHLNTLFKNYANILVIIMRLRQLCCHPLLCAKAVQKLDHAKHIMENLMEEIEDNDKLNADLNSKMDAINQEDRTRLVSQVLMFLSSSDSEECSICLEVLSDPVITYCAHIYCSTCINEVIESSTGNSCCPLCRSNIDENMLLKIPSTKAEVEKEKENDTPLVLEKANAVPDDNDEWKSSAKIQTLMKCLNDLREEDPDMKSLIVSQFTSFLDIVELPLSQQGYQFCRLDGTMNQAERVRAMNEFKGTDDTSPTIMLLSLTAGGVGLNLVSACRVFLLDPAWNPAVEEQCFDRCHRLGQTRDVKIYKLIVKDSVEERMLILQEKKRKLMQKAFGGGLKMNADQRRRAAIRDISTLLNMNLNVNNILPPTYVL